MLFKILPPAPTHVLNSAFNVSVNDTLFNVCAKRLVGDAEQNIAMTSNDTRK